MLKLKFKVDKKLFKVSKKIFMFLIFRCEIEKISDISSSKKFWNSSDKIYGVIRFWMLVLNKWRSRSQELSIKMSPELSEGSYFSVSKF